jgi:DNA-binding LytR/AlgR family response regulator
MTQTTAVTNPFDHPDAQRRFRIMRNIEELQRALTKFRKWTQPDIVQYLARLSQLSPVHKYKDKLLIPVKDKLLPVNLKDVSCFYTTDKSTYIYMKDGNIYPYSRTLEQICSLLNPEDFIRANKQFIIARNSVADITIWFDSRLLVTLDVDIPERIYISKNKAVEFKAWIVSDN